jgi:hypothetical protein
MSDLDDSSSVKNKEHGQSARTKVL